MKALILGLGQDAILAAKECQNLGVDYRILVRRSSGLVSKVRDNQIDNERIIYQEIISYVALLKVKERFDYTHVYNFAGNSFVQDSKINFQYFIETNSKILWSLLNVSEMLDDLWIFHPLSSEILVSAEQMSSVSGRLSPRNAYGIAKAVDYHVSEVFREESGKKLHSCIIFNHESSLRPPQFFTKKVCSYFSERDPKRELSIYNAKSKRDWGSAPEFVKLILDSGTRGYSGTSELGTGHLMSVEAFIDNCFNLSMFDFEKKTNNGLITWRSSRHTIIERSRNRLDVERVVCSDTAKVKGAFRVNPKCFGKDLVRALLSNEI